MTHPFRRKLVAFRAVRRVRRLYWKARFRCLRRLAPSWKRAADGLPIPPLELRRLVGNTSPSPVDFLDMGALCARRLEEALGRHGASLPTLGAILDFGCGCGRTIRHFEHLRGTRLHGTDYNAALVGWCRPNLAFAEFGLNELEPPLGYPARAFDLVYAFSVLTHMSEPVQDRWILEFARVLGPGGYLVLSTMPEQDLPAGDQRAHDILRSGRRVVFNADLDGANACVAFHPQSYLEDALAPAFELLEFIPAGVGQDFWLFRKRPQPSALEAVSPRIGGDARSEHPAGPA